MLYDAFTRLSGLHSHYVMNLARDTELNENIIFDDVRRYLLYISTCMHLHTSMCVCVDVTLLSSVNWLVYLPVSVVGFLSTFHLIVCSRFIAFSLYTRAKSTSFEPWGWSYQKPSSNVIFLLMEKIIKWNVLDVIFRCRPSNIKHSIKRWF